MPSTPPSVIISIDEREVLRLILEFLEGRKLHITQLSLERETGVINAEYSEDVLFLRQLILDGQWDSARDFVEPLKDVEGFDAQLFRFYITKYKYFELLCIKQEPGPMHDHDFAVEEIVECLRELERICPNNEEFRHLCALLTLPKLSDHRDFRNWNPSSARVECFHKVLSLVSEFIDGLGVKQSQNVDSLAISTNERLVQLITKGLLYESAVDYCQAQALEGKNAPKPQTTFTKILLQKQKLSSTDLSLVSWLEVLGTEQFTVPFQQKSLDFKMEQLKKPKLDAQWTEQILGTPIKPNQFPYSLVPHSKLKCAQKMSQSMVIPSGSSSLSSLSSANNFDTGTPSSNRRKSQQQPNAHQMSHSTMAAIGGFSIKSGQNAAVLDDSAMRQSQLITNMLTADSSLEGTTTTEDPPSATHQSATKTHEESSSPVSPSPPTSSTTNSNTTNSMRNNFPDPMTSSRHELESFSRRVQPPPTSLFGLPQRPMPLPPVPELSTPGGTMPMAFPGVSGQIVAVSAVDNPMVNSRLFQEFSNRQQQQMGMAYGQPPQMAHIHQVPSPHLGIYYPPPQPYNNFAGNDGFVNNGGFNPVLFAPTQQPQFQPFQAQQQMAQIYGGNNGAVTMRLQNYGAPISARPSSMTFPQMVHSTSNISVVPPRPKSSVETASGRVSNGSSSTDSPLPVQFVPLCRYEDAQAIRAVAFHPGGRHFAIGTNSRQLLVCKYPDKQETKVLPGSGSLSAPEVLLSRPKLHRGSVYCCDFDASGGLLATGSNDKSVRLMAFNAETCKIGAEMELALHDGTVRDLVFVDGAIVTGGAGNCQIYATDCATGRATNAFGGHLAPILGLYNWGSSTDFVSCSQDKSIRFWDLRSATAINIINPSNATRSPVTSVSVDPSGKLLVSGHEDATVMLYDVVGGRIIQIFRPHGDQVRTVRFSNAAFYLLSGSYDKRVVITDMRGDLSGPLMYLPVAEHADKVIKCRWHPRDFTFLSTSADRSAVLWSLPTSN